MIKEYVLYDIHVHVHLKISGSGNVDAHGSQLLYHYTKHLPKMESSPKPLVLMQDDGHANQYSFYTMSSLYIY